MDTKKRQFHDLSDEEDNSASDHEIQEDSRFSAIPNKRRRRSKSQSSEDDPVEDRGQTGAEEAGIDENDEGKTAENGNSEPSTGMSSTNQLKRLTPAQLAASQRKAKKTGVIYISRVPPFMKPATVRKLLSPFGEIGRIFLTPEAVPAYQKRVRAGGNKKKSFVDGWVEFAQKKEAKACVDLLNGNTIGGKKSGFYHDDIWNLKYLKGFKWADLMEQVQIEERMREGRLRAELQREAKERNAFLANMEIDQRAKARARRAEAEQGTSGRGSAAANDALQANKAAQTPARPAFERHFRQNEIKTRKATLDGQGGEVHRVLRSIF